MANQQNSQNAGSNSKKQENVKKSKNGTGKPYNKKGYNRAGKPNREQPKKDSSSKRINFDNAREDKVANQIEKDARSGKFNDINDFLKNPTLLKAAANFPVAPILGTEIGQAAPVPGVMQLRWVPTFGNYAFAPARTVTSPYDATKSIVLSKPPIAMNQSSDSTYSFVMHANSRSYDWTASDLNILLQAGMEVFSIITAMKRAFGFARSIQEQTLYKPQAVLAAMGFDYDDLRDDLGKAWWDLNNLIVQSRQIWIPDVFPILNRRLELNSNFYKDAPGDYAQIYVYTQGHYFMYDPKATRSGGGLDRVTFTVNRTKLVFSPGEPTYQTQTGGNPLEGFTVYKWDTWVQVAQLMIDALIDSEDRGNIYGNLLAAYGSERIVALPEVDDTYRVEPEYTPEISMQVENMRLVSSQFAPIGLVQFADKLYPVYTDATGKVGNTTFDVAREHILNFHFEADPTPEMKLLATRFQALGMFPVAFPKIGSTTDLPSVGRAYVPYTAGSELMVSAAIVASPTGELVRHPNRADAYIQDYGNRFWYVTGNGIGLIDGARKSQDFWNRAMAFDWHPFGTDGATVSAPADPGELTAGSPVSIMGVWPSEYFGDFDKYTWTETGFMKQINDTAEYSLWGVPQI